MSDKKRKRTAEHHLKELDRIALGIAADDIFDHNFRRLLADGTIVTETPKERSFLYRKLAGFVKRLLRCK